MSHVEPHHHPQIIHQYTTDKHTAAELAHEYGCSNTTILNILHQNGIQVRTAGRRSIDPGLPLHQPHIAYCGICDKKALYVFTEQGAGGGMTDGGHILELDPHPKGRWIDRGDGIYQRKSTVPLDGSGRRGHACGNTRTGGPYKP